jgi:hypothetical protein
MNGFLAGVGEYGSARFLAEIVFQVTEDEVCIPIDPRLIPDSEVREPCSCSSSVLEKSRASRSIETEQIVCRTIEPFTPRNR